VVTYTHVVYSAGFARVKKVTITSLILSGPARHASSRQSSQTKEERCGGKHNVSKIFPT